MNKDLLKRIAITLFILFVYRMGCYITLVGIDANALLKVFPAHGRGFFGVINTFSGGALSHMAIFSLGVVPYISAGMIVQMLSSSVGVDFFIKMKKEGAAGRAKMEKYTHWLSFMIAFSQSLVACSVIIRYFSQDLSSVFFINRVLFLILGVFTLMTGTMCVIWMSSQISKKGIGNGTSVIMYTGIISQISSYIMPYLRNIKSPVAMMTKRELIIFFSVMAVILFIIVVVENTYRILRIRYTMMSNAFVPTISTRKQLSVQNTHKMPLKINLSGIMAAVMSGIMLSTVSYPLGVLKDLLLRIPRISPYIAKIYKMSSKGDILYNILFGIILIFCIFVYTPVVFDPKEVADNLRKSSACIIDISPGEKTVLYLENVIDNLLYFASVYLCCICIIPNLVTAYTNSTMRLQGTSMLILASVPIELYNSIRSYKKENYSNLLKEEKIKFD